MNFDKYNLILQHNQYTFETVIIKYYKMKKQLKKTDEKKFNLEKMQVVKLTNMRKVVGGQGDNPGNGQGNDDTTITDKVQRVSNGLCLGD